MELYEYENYLDGKVILFQSRLIKQSLGLDKLPTNRINQMIYNLKIDGSKVNNEPIYVLDGEEEGLFIKDLEAIEKNINIGVISFKNIVFQENFTIKQAIQKIKEKATLDENILNQIRINSPKTLKEIVKEKVYEMFKINLYVNKKQKALPIFIEKN